MGFFNPMGWGYGGVGFEQVPIQNQAPKLIPQLKEGGEGEESTGPSQEATVTAVDPNFGNMSPGSFGFGPSVSTPVSIGFNPFGGYQVNVPDYGLSPGHLGEVADAAAAAEANAAADAATASEDTGAGSGFGDGPAWAKGGYVGMDYNEGGPVSKMLIGPNPKGPDDGYGALDYGEYVITKNMVGKYGKDFMRALNEGDLSKTAVRSLLKKN